MLYSNHCTESQYHLSNVYYIARPVTYFVYPWLYFDMKPDPYIVFYTPMCLSFSGLMPPLNSCGMQCHLKVWTAKITKGHESSGATFCNTLRWRHNGRDSVSNHQPHDCLLNRLFRHRSKKTSKLRVTGLCAGIHRGPVNSPHKGPVTYKMFPFDDVIMIFIVSPQSIKAIRWGDCCTQR